MSLDQILMIPGYSGSGGGGGPASSFPDPASYYNPTLATSTYVASYSLLRPLRAGVTDVMLCRRASDNAELAFGGLYDATTVSDLETWSQGGDVFVKTIYDHEGSAHLTQATASKQAKIVDTGTCVYHPERPNRTTTPKIPGMDMELATDDCNYTGTLGSAADRIDISVTEIFRHAASGGGTSERLTTLVIGAESNYALRHDADSGLAYVANSAVLYKTDDESTAGLSPQIYKTGIHTVTVNGTSATWHRNNTICEKRAHSETTATSTTIQLGTSSPGSLSASSGLFTEMIITTALDDADRNTLYAAVNGFTKIGPTSTHTVAGYQVEPWQEVLNDWLATVTAGDVAVTPGTLTWDGTYASNDELSALWLTSEIIDDDFSLTADAKYWVADDGGGAGFLPSHTNKYHVWRQTPSQSGVTCARLAMYYSLELPLSGGGNGNPFYGQGGVAMRSLVQAAAGMVGHARDQMSGPTYAAMADIGGGSIGGCWFAFDELSSLLSTSVRNAFYEAGLYFARTIEQNGARHDNANMDCKSIPFLVGVYNEAVSQGDTDGQALALRAAKQVLFGSTTGTPATSVWDLGDNPKAGVYATAGHIPENGTPETTYNGHSFKEISLAYALAGGVLDWSFLGTMIDAYNDWKELQSFNDITTISGDAFQGPSGYSSRTTDPTWRDQAGGSSWKHAIMSERDAGGRWIARYFLDPPSTATMVSNIQSAITAVSNEEAATVPDATGTAAAHTNGYDWTTGNTFTVDTATNELVIVGTHNLQVNDPVVPYNSFGTAPTCSAGSFGANRFWYVVAVSGQRIQVSTTLGGSAVTFSDEGFATDYSPHIFLPIYYLTNSPDLTYPVSGTTPRHWLEVGSESGMILEVDDTADMVAALTPGTAVAPGSAVNYRIVSGPNDVGVNMHWPILPVPSVASGWYDTLKNLVDTNDSSTFTRTESSGTSYNLSLDDEWWAYKNTDGTLEHAWFVSANTYGGANFGHHGMNLEALWVEDFGVAILTRRFDEPSVDGLYSNVHSWFTGHVWGMDDKGTPTAFSTSRGDQPDATNSFNLAGSPPTVSVTRQLGASTAGGTSGMEDGDEISGTMTTTNTFAVNPVGDGIRVSVSVSSDQADSVTELWHTIPIYLRDARQAMSDTAIQYWDGATWTSLSGTLVNADWVRLTRNHGSGDKYVFIHFTSTQGVKLNPAAVQESSQGQARGRMLHINLHSTTPGSTALLPSVGSPATVTYDIQTTDPGLVPSAPSVAVSYPATNDVLFATEGSWFARATITGTGSITATLQYSTDSTDGSDGTWNTAGTMTNTTGDVYEFVGSDFSGDAAIPTGLTYVRVQATDTAGTTNSPVAVTSTSPSLVLEDGFGSSDDTAIDGSYTGWTTNTTGNTYTQTLGILECRSNKCIRDKTADGGVTFGASVRIDIGTTDCISEVDVVPNATHWHAPGPGCQHCATTANLNNIRWVISRNSLQQISIVEQSTIRADLMLGTPMGSTDTIRLRFQTKGSVAIGMAYNVTTATYLGYAVYTSHGRAGTGFGFGEEDEQATLDNVKCWKA